MDVICNSCSYSMNHLQSDLWICDHCGLISSTIPPDHTQYDKSYVIKYRRYERSKDGQAIQQLRADMVRRNTFGVNTVLDFGCGVGSFIKEIAKDGNFIARGYDINPFGGFNNVEILFQPWDVATFWDSLEHMERPRDLIVGLKPKYIFACAPCLDDWKGEITDWKHYYPGEHLHYFTEASFRKLLEYSGYEVVEVNFYESKHRRGGGEKNIISIGGRKRG